MNNNLQDLVRSEILEGLQKLPAAWQLIFKRMYSHENLDAPLDQIVNNIPEERLNWAMQQIINSLNKVAKEVAA